MAKVMYTARNETEGIDLYIERDSGNVVRILTGNPENSLQNWENLRQLCDEAIEALPIMPPPEKR